MKRPAWISLSNLGIMLLGVAMVASLMRVWRNSREASEHDKIVLRIAHWQLETGYREALEAIIEDYQRLHPHVRIEQVTIADQLYGQWLNTHLIAGTAPDLCEFGYAKLTTEDAYAAHYFLPLTDEADQPNPYNRGTNLEGVPWRDTFIDGMRGGFRESLQEYFAAPLVVYSMRLFYDKELLREATGRDGPPRTFAQLLDDCRKVRELGERLGRKITPIVSTADYGPFRDAYRGAFTSSFEPVCDIDLTGDIPQSETYLGFASGAWSMRSPPVRAYFELLYRICQELPHGFNGMDRQQAGFLFVQGRAAFLTSGAWDARSLVEQAKGRFTVAITDFPMPAPDEPFGQYVQARTCEQMNGGTPLGIYRGSRHADVAIDFLRYLTSRRGNERFCRLADWPPVVLGAEPSELMKPFMPDPIGFKARLEFDEIGFYPKATYRAELPRYLNGEISYESFARTYEQALSNPNFGGDRFIALEYDRAWRSARMDDRLLAIQSMLALADDSPDRRAIAEAKYRRLLQRQVLKNNGEYLRYIFEKIRRRPIPPPP